MKIIMQDLYWDLRRKVNSICEFFWALKPKNWKFWVVKPPTLNIKYNDARELYLHTSMKVLCDFYHNQLEHGNVCWDGTEEQLAIWHEIEAIARWWEHVYPTYELIWKKPDHIIEPDYWNDKSEDYKEYWDWLSSVGDQEVINEEAEQLMVERLSKIYKYLWD